MCASQIVEVASGLYQIRIPVPIRSLGYVFSYFVQDRDHNLLIDTGWPSQEALSQLESSLSEIGVSLDKIETIVVSHLHPDHFGLAEQIRDRAKHSKLIMHQADASMILESYEDYKKFINELHEWLSTHGTPETELKSMLDASVEMLHFFRPPKPTTIVTGGERISVGDKWNFEVIPTPGHSVGMICLYDRSGSRILFSGDHVLPTITPNVSLGPFYKGNPLGDYLESLDLINRLDVEIVLPSHEHLFSDLKKRVIEIKHHHEERLSDAIGVMKQGGQSDVMSGYQIASKLRWYSGSWEFLGPWEKRAALMETLAHLEYLKRQGTVAEVDEVIGQRPSVRYALIRELC